MVAFGVAFGVAFELRLCNSRCFCIAFGRTGSVAFALRLHCVWSCVCVAFCVLRLRLCAAKRGSSADSCKNMFSMLFNDFHWICICFSMDFDGVPLFFDAFQCSSRADCAAPWAGEKCARAAGVVFNDLKDG